ncbi:MAG: ABC transporter ATP-binding protein [Candidatus Latescibacterota bacterium]|jgi:oligopeptide/dipeptide ABC transporter ATP-binding protein
MSRPLLEIENLKKHYPVHSGLWGKVHSWVKAVDGVSLQIREGETLGVVGESGCGKTTLGRLLLRLIEATDGRVVYQGRDLMSMGKGDMRALRRRMQIIFQDPYSSLNPRMTVGGIIGEALKIHQLVEPDQIGARIAELMDMVGLQSSYSRRYPHEFSGGQRQRIGIARALAVEPEFIVADEPVSALDVSIQAQIINLLQDLQRDLGLTYMFIAHDLSVVRHISDRVAVMYLGRIVELAERDQLYEEPSHPYTRALLSAVPVPEPGAAKQRIVLEGDVPNPASIPSGCPFHPRCAERRDFCTQIVPQLVDLGNGHQTACLLRYPEGMAQEMGAAQASRAKEE